MHAGHAGSIITAKVLYMAACNVRPASCLVVLQALQAAFVHAASSTYPVFFNCPVFDAAFTLPFFMNSMCSSCLASVIMLVPSYCFLLLFMQVLRIIIQNKRHTVTHDAVAQHGG